jgi:hypothetical protein
MNADATFAALNSSKLGKKRSLTDIIEVLARLRLSEVGDLCTTISDALPKPASVAPSAFSFIANGELGGAVSTCANPACRLENVDSMARFAALYADKVLLPDPFALLGSIAPSVVENQSTFFLLDVATYIRLLYDLRPLLDTGLVAYADTKHHQLCTECYAKAIGESKNRYAQKLSRTHNFLTKKFFDEIRIDVTEITDEITYDISGPEAFLPHGGYLKHGTNIPPSLKKRSSELPFSLTRAQIQRLGLLDADVQEILDDILRSNYYSNEFGLNYLTDR